MDEIKIKHQDVASNENKNMAMALFKKVDDEPDLIEDPAFAELNYQYKEFLIRQIFKPAT